MSSDLSKRDGNVPAQYDIVAYRPELKQQVIGLQSGFWSPSPVVNRAYFEWKHEQNPYVPGPLVYLALHEGRVVGMRSFFGVRWQACSPSESLIGLYADDMVVAREHRDRGLLPQIMAAAFEDLARRGYRYVFNLSAGPVTMLSSLSMGWRQVGAMEPRRWRSWQATCAAAARRVARPLHDHWCRGSTTTGSLATLEPDEIARRFRWPPLVSFTVAPRIDAMSALVERLGTDGRIRHVRDREYFEWRLRNPLRRYGYLYADGPEGSGYLILQEPAPESAEAKVLHVVDWEGTSLPVLGRLLEAACFAARRPGLLFVWSATLTAERLAIPAWLPRGPTRGSRS
jgi:GNAT superfamily N-acetyltransferase